MTNCRRKTALFFPLCLAAAAFISTGCGSQNAGSEKDSSVAETAWDGRQESVTGGAACSGSLATVSGEGISAEGAAITISAAGAYELSGTLENGSLIIDAGKNDGVVLIFNDFHLTSQETAPILGQQSQSVTVTLKEGTDNSITAGSEAAGQENDGPDAALFTYSDLLVNGTGSLTIQSTGQYGIRSKQNLTAESGNISIVSDSGGMKAQTLLAVKGGTYTMDTTGDAFHSKQDMVIDGGAFTVSTGDDAFHADGHLTVNGGTIDIPACYEGLEGQSVTVNGGKIDLTASDDGINASSDSSGDLFIRITGGEIHVSAEGDGLDSNGDLYMEGGILYVDGPVSGGDSALDYDGTGTVTGGTIVAAGSGRMLQSFGNQSSQQVITVYYEQTQAAGTAITLTGPDGTELLSYAPSKEFSSAVISIPGFTDGASYTLSTGEYEEEFTISGILNSVGAKPAGSNMRQGGRPGGNTPGENDESRPAGGGSGGEGGGTIPQRP